VNTRQPSLPPQGPTPFRVLLGVTGGIAAYKALELARLCRKAGWQVQVVMTESARKFVGAESFRTLTGNPVACELFPKGRSTLRTPRSAPRPLGPATGPETPPVEHVDLAASANLVVVAPATANIIGKLASGIADNLLSTLLLAVPGQTVQEGRVLIAPAMNTNMWQHPAVAANVKRLAGAGYRFVSPAEGELACGSSGPGRMAEPADIFAACRAALAPRRHKLKRPDPRPSSLAPCLMQSIRVVVTAGRTEEPLDVVRVLTNRSSGRMGVEIARAFSQAGAQVRMVAGELSVPLPSGVAVTRATTADRMQTAVLAALPSTDVLVMCAAVADYRPARVAAGKLHESGLTLRLQRTPDILKEVNRRAHRALVVGFSLDSSLARARTKLKEKGLDLMVANPFTTPSSGSIRARLLYRTGRTRGLPAMPKSEFARLLVSEVARLYGERTEQ